jgi:Holliday junction resolvase
MRSHVKRDANHGEIVDVLKSYGFSVYDAAHAGRGFPDLVVGFDGLTFLAEIKSGEKKPLTDGQKEFAEQWRGSPVVVLRSRANAVSWAANLRHERRRANAIASRGELPACIHRHREGAA